MNIINYKYIYVATYKSTMFIFEVTFMFCFFMTQMSLNCMDEVLAFYNSSLSNVYLFLDGASFLKVDSGGVVTLTSEAIASCTGSGP